MGRLLALAFLTGCGAGGETGADVADGFGEPLPCADGYATADRENGIPLSFVCEEAAGTGDEEVWTCAVYGAAIYADRIKIGCPAGAQVYLRWL